MYDPQTPHVTITPITEFTLACDRLLNDPITRDALTKDELDILKMCVQRLTERFFSQPCDEMSPGQPGVDPPVVLPHGSGGPVE
jgi:hypothetical protein